MGLDIAPTLLTALQRPLIDTAWGTTGDIDAQVLSKHAIIA
jgi:hypothetical protein